MSAPARRFIRAQDRSGSVLLILDMIGDFAFDGGAKAAKAALPVARRILRLKERARAAGIPSVYVNDEIGTWRSEFSAVVRHCQRSLRGGEIARMLAPLAGDYRILKPRHSGFFATSLDVLLQALGARRLILTGVSSNQCVLFTANDAYVREFDLWIPRDCISARSPAETAFALRYFKDVLGADLRASTARGALHRARTTRKAAVFSYSSH